MLLESLKVLPDLFLVQLLSLAGSPNLVRVLVGFNLFHFTIIVATMLLGTVRTLEMVGIPVFLCLTTKCYCGGLESVA